jgi:polar amino acid transport system substrate-binding protein
MTQALTMIKTLLCLVTFTLATTSVFAKSPIVLCYDLSPAPPFINKRNNSSNNHQGFLIDLIDFVSKEADVSFQLVNKPWKRCIQDGLSGKIDAIPGMMWTSGRSENFEFPRDKDNSLNREQHFWSVDNIIFVRKKSKLQWNGKQFSGVDKGIGAGLGFVVYDMLAADGVLATDIKDSELGLSLVANNRLDGYVTNEFVGKKLIRQLNMSEQITFLPIPYYRSGIFFAFSKKSINASKEDKNNVWVASIKARLRFEALLKKSAKN